MIKIKTISGGELKDILEVKYKVFSGGEVHVNVNSLELCKEYTELIIEAKIKCSDDIMALLMLKDAMDHLNLQVSALILPYLSYSRQDRVCTKGDAFSLKVYKELLDTKFDCAIITCDAHSTVAEDLGFVNYPQVEIWKDLIIHLDKLYNGITLCAPDAGALEKTADLALETNTSYLTCLKVRNPVNGRLSGFHIPVEDRKLISGIIVIVDDICDGGGTFLGVYDELKKYGAEGVILCTTHGIYSKGLNVLDKFGSVYCTESFMEYKDYLAVDKTFTVNAIAETLEIPVNFIESSIKQKLNKN